MKILRGYSQASFLKFLSQAPLAILMSVSPRFSLHNSAACELGANLESWVSTG
jgi:hypothetical protein